MEEEVGVDVPDEDLGSFHVLKKSSASATGAEVVAAGWAASFDSGIKRPGLLLCTCDASKRKVRSDKGLGKHLHFTFKCKSTVCNINKRKNCLSR